MKHKSGIPVDAPPNAIFDLLERDRTEFHNDELVQREPVGDLPFGPGYRFKSTVVHGPDLCTMETRVTVCRRPYVLHEEWVHVCRAARKTITGSQRFEITEDHTGTLLVLSVERRNPGLNGLLKDLFGAFCNPARQGAALLAMRAQALALSRR